MRSKGSAEVAVPVSPREFDPADLSEAADILRAAETTAESRCHATADS